VTLPPPVKTPKAMAHGLLLGSGPLQRPPFRLKVSTLFERGTLLLQPGRNQGSTCAI
jgi:hypothetical protein